MKYPRLSLASVLLLLVLGAEPATQPVGEKSDQEASVPAVLNFSMKRLSGASVDLKNYQGKVVLMVNTASKCGLTPQYKSLEGLHEKYNGKGLAILGFPTNNFGAQEPGTDEQIGTFCEKNYGVKFDMFSKISVKGEDQHALYKVLTTAQGEHVKPGEISWNFEKFLIDKSGNIAYRFAPQVSPDAPEVVQAIETLLK